MSHIPRASFVPSVDDLGAAIKCISHLKQVREEGEQQVAEAKREGAERLAKFKATLAEEMAAWKKQCNEEKERHAAIRARYDAINAATKAVDTAEEDVQAANIAAIFARKHDNGDAQAKLVAAQTKLGAAQEALRMAKNKDKELCCFCCERKAQ